MPREQSRARRHAGSVLRLLAFALAVYVVWPISLGGQFASVIVSGQSMEPTMIAGDLALIRAGNEVEVGDVVVYRPQVQPEAHVIHRVVGVDGDDLVLQGDNNAWIDPFDVVREDVQGIVFATVPRAGSWISRLADPLVWGSSLVVGAGLWWIATRRERKAAA